MFAELVTLILLSMLPISELRGAIPYGIFSGLNLVLVFFVSVIANILVIPIIFFFLTFVHNYLMRISVYDSLFVRIIETVRRKTHRQISKYGYLGLMFLVAIPLPVTGAYTASLAAWLFDMEKKKAFLAMSMGVVIAGIIVTTVVLSGAEVGIFIKNILIN